MSCVGFSVCSSPESYIGSDHGSSIGLILGSDFGLGRVLGLGIDLWLSKVSYSSPISNVFILKKNSVLK